MSAPRFLGDFLQSMLFGGTYEDVAFEIRVLKSELTRLHERLDKELGEVRDRLDKLEGKPGRGKGRGRLQILGGTEIADGKIEAASAPAPPLKVSPPPSETAAHDLFSATMTIADAHAAHPAAAVLFANYHLPSCTFCALSDRESIEEGGRDHGLDVEALLRDLNQLAEA
jgi:hybrid cluster-associated redox disulfide protein